MTLKMTPECTTLPECATLKDIGFADIYLGECGTWLSGGDIQLDPVPAPPSVRDELRALREKCVEVGKESGKGEFAIRHDGVTFRVSSMQTMNEMVYVLRRFPTTVPNLKDLGLHHGHVQRLMTHPMSGLVVVAGAFGQGKTTTASGMIVSRLTEYGGVCVTIEDPPEMPMEGRHGEGVCYQTWSEYGRFGEALRHAARWAPSIIFVGEVRDPETATEALRASINGRLVVCTVHADNVIAAVERLFSLAAGVAGTPEDVASLMSKGLACVLHQRLEGQPKRPKIEMLFLRDEESTGAKNLIKARRFEQLGSEITLQYNRLLFGSRMASEAQSS